MATANSTRDSAGSSLSAETDEFAGLSRRLLVTVNHVVLVAQHFADLADLPSEHVAAGMTLCEAAKDLDRLYEELDSWYVRHEHQPKAGFGLGVFTDDRADRTPLSGLPPAVPRPFCARHDDIKISGQVHAQGRWYEAHCGVCCAQAPGGETIAEAAQHWNKRGEL